MTEQQNAGLRWTRQRVNLPTDKTSAEIVRDIPAQIRARAFFSARVAEAHILERFRIISDDYTTGKIGRDEARNLMLEYARTHGKDDGTNSLRNLASTARLNLILDQNAKMSRAVGDHERMYSPANKAAFPFVIYRASVGSRNPRSEHKRHDGKVFSKDDPWLRTHWPPSEFGCNCRLENCSAKRAAMLGGPQPPTPPEKVKVESRSGFEFDPRTAFEEFDLSAIDNPEQRFRVREEAEINFGSQVSFKGNVAKVEPWKDFHTFEDENLEPASEWRKRELPPNPEPVSTDKAREQLESGLTIQSGDGEDVKFDTSLLVHWELETGKAVSDILGRLSRLPMALETVTHPMEIWDQGTQKAYIQAFRKETGGYSGCLVFVMKDGSVRTYFLKDLNALNKARKGLSVKRIGGSTD